MRGNVKLRSWSKGVEGELDKMKLEYIWPFAVQKINM